MSQNTLDFEITGLSNHDGYDIKIKTVIGADSVKINQMIGRPVISTSHNPSPMLPNSPQTDHEEAAAAAESLKIKITIENKGKDLKLHTSESSSGADGTGRPINVQTKGLEASDGTGTSDNESSPTRHLTSHDEHGMTLIVGDRSSYKCSGCKESGIGERYKCNEECPYILHPECRHHEEEATHEFLNGSTFKFFEELSSEEHRSCVACGSDIKGYFYHCEVTNKNLHPCCLNLKKTIQVGKMKFLLCKKLTSTCFYCHPNKKENMDKCWCYSLESGQDLQAHVSCINDAIIECLKSERKEKRRNTKRSIKLKISVLLKWAKKLLWEVIEFFKSSNTHVENTTQFLKSAKIQLEKIITVLEMLEKPLKKTALVLGSACMHLGKVNAILGGIIIILESLLIVISGFAASPQTAKA